MKILISADMEGTCGVSSWVHVTPPELAGSGPASTAEYERARLRMTHEVNAAIEGALAGGATEVIVNDAHDGMRNLIPEELHPEAQFVAGSDKPLVMVQGVEDGVDAVFFTGYHARAGTPDGPLAHTWSLWLQDVRVNGVSTGEYGINAITAGHFGVPVALVTGDNRAVEQTRELLGQQVEGAIVKHGYSVTSAVHLQPEEARRVIREAAERAVRNIDAMRPYVLPEGAIVELDFDHQIRASHAAEIPGVELVGWRTVRFMPKDGLDFHRWFRSACRAAGVM
ncbi:MAG TPA: M55 family metallopeptidase [Thermomicrobiales bacterium]|nr:M55 family metallopeptidase [Thermomicrobiales bacterium]